MKPSTKVEASKYIFFFFELGGSKLKTTSLISSDDDNEKTFNKKENICPYIMDVKSNCDLGELKKKANLLNNSEILICIIRQPRS